MSIIYGTWNPVASTDLNMWTMIVKVFEFIKMIGCFYLFFSLNLDSDEFLPTQRVLWEDHPHGDSSAVSDNVAAHRIQNGAQDIVPRAYTQHVPHLHSASSLFFLNRQCSRAQHPLPHQWISSSDEFSSQKLHPQCSSQVRVHGFVHSHRIVEHDRPEVSRVSQIHSVSSVLILNTIVFT